MSTNDQSPTLPMSGSRNNKSSEAVTHTEIRRKRKQDEISPTTTTIAQSGGGTGTRNTENFAQLSEIIGRLKNENLSFHWQNNELKCENKRLYRLYEENMVNQKVLHMQYDELKKAILDQKLQLKQLQEENKYLQSLIHNRKRPMYPMTNLSPEREPTLISPDCLNLPPLSSLFDREKVSISRIID